MRRLGALSVLAAAVVLLAAGPAAAHAKLVSTSPGSGAALASVPSSVSLTFDEAVSPEDATVLVTAPDGTSLTAGPAKVDEAVVTVPLKASTAVGGFHVSWRVVSDDGHPVTGEWRFTVGAAGAAAAAPAPAEQGPAGDPPTNWWVTHMLHLVIGAGIVGVGGWLMLVLTRPPKARRGTA